MLVSRNGLRNIRLVLRVVSPRDDGSVLESGDIVIASLDGEFTVKTLRVRGAGRRAGGSSGGQEDDGVWLEPANPQYPSIKVDRGHDMRVFGVVTAVIHRFRRG